MAVLKRRARGGMKDNIFMQFNPQHIELISSLGNINAWWNGDLLLLIPEIGLRIW